MQPDRGSICPRCNKNPRRRPGSPCLSCWNAERRADRAIVRAAEAKPEKPGAVAARVAREASDYAALKPEDFSAGIATQSDPQISREANQERAQYYARAMGDFAEFIRDPSTASPEEAAKLGAYMARLAEEERRFGNRRLARSVSLAHAHEQLARRQFLQAAKEHLGPVTPQGFARRPPSKAATRTVCLLLSDLHIGADLAPRDNPEPYGAVQESRRLSKIFHEAADYKPQYRENSELVVLLNGDLVEGDLMHDRRAGAPLTEQKVAFLSYFRTGLSFLASVYKSVRVVCQPGNHGRDKLRHHGRATESKWDGVEWELYQCLRMMLAGHANMAWDIPFKAVSVVDLHGSKLLLTHGDTEVKVKHPDQGASENAKQLHKINSTRLYGHQFDVAAFGHFHSPRFQPKRPTRMIFNGALVPPSGYARTEGYVDEPCGQMIWEAVEGYPVGDLRFVQVGEAEDRDESLSTLLTPFRFPA